MFGLKIKPVPKKVTNQKVVTDSETGSPPPPNRHKHRPQPGPPLNQSAELDEGYDDDYDRAYEEQPAPYLNNRNHTSNDVSFDNNDIEEPIYSEEDTPIAPPVKKGFSFLSKKDKKDKPAKAVDAAPDMPVQSEKKEKKPKKSKGKPPQGLPVRIVMGYLPEISESDAKDYAFGIADKHFEQIGMAFLDVHRFKNGFAYEVHEGGAAKAYLPQIIKYFDDLPPFSAGEDFAVRIPTATRMVEVSRTREGLTVILLPEDTEAEASDWLTPTKALKAAMNERTGFFITGIAVFLSGFIAAISSGMAFRLQAYEEPPVLKTEMVTVAELPLFQWSRLEPLMARGYVKALRYNNGKWEAPELVPHNAPNYPN